LTLNDLIMLLASESHREEIKEVLMMRVYDEDMHICRTSLL
jgi:hypothetical protein